MKAVSANLTFFFDETSTSESEIKHRLEVILTTQFAGVGDWSVRWQDDVPLGDKETEDLKEKLDRLDT